MISTVKRQNRFSIRPAAVGALGLSLCLFATASGARDGAGVRSLSDRVREADDYYLGRRNLENVQAAIRLLQQAVAENPQDYESWWRISMFTCYAARHTTGSEKMRYLEAGTDAGRKAAALVPNRPEGHFWLGANLGLTAEARGFLKALALVDPIRKEMETVIRLDPNYEQAAGLRTLARLDYRAPFFKGGDKRHSVELLKEALGRFPNNSLTMLYLSDSYITLGRRAEAKAQLESILKLCPDPLYGPEQEENQAVARERLARWMSAGN